MWNTTDLYALPGSLHLARAWARWKTGDEAGALHDCLAAANEPASATPALLLREEILQVPRGCCVEVIGLM